jgi:hypothetical protein
MPITLDEQGIKLITDFTLLQESSVEASLEESEPLVEYSGEVAADEAIELFDPKFRVEGSGIGDVPAGLAVATDGGFTHEALEDGVTIVTNLRHGESADGRNTFSFTAENRPGATAVVAP